MATATAKKTRPKVAPARPPGVAPPPECARCTAIGAALRRDLAGSRLGDTPTPGGATLAELIAHVLIRHALAGDVGAIRTILDRTEGRVPQHGRDSGLTVVVVHGDGRDDIPPGAKAYAPGSSPEDL